MRYVKIFLIVLSIVVVAAACMPKQSINRAALKVENNWKIKNDAIIGTDGRRSYNATKMQGFQAAQLAASRLGMVVEEQTYETGFLFVTAPAPVPLTMIEWQQVQRAETGELRQIVDEDLGLYKWWVELDPSGKDVLVNVFVTEKPGGVDVSLGLRLRVKDSSTDTLKRVQPPPTAVRMGLSKFWAAYEMELDMMLHGTSAPTPNAAGGEETSSAKPPRSDTAAVLAGGTMTVLPENNADAIAVIIGNRNYRGNLPVVAFAHRDAAAWKQFAVGVLGVGEQNIIDLRDTGLKEMETVFGNSRTHQGKLWRWVRQGDSDVFVFYSGHGVPGVKDKRAYLLPIDATVASVESQGYPLDLLYQNLANLQARSVTVFIDACFSGQTPDGTLVKNASGIQVVPSMPQQTALTVISAAQADQVANWDREAQYGLFTRYLLAGLQGGADQSRYGVKDRQVTLAEIQAYLDREMSYAARRQYGRSQEAMVVGDPAKVLVRLKSD